MRISITSFMGTLGGLVVTALGGWDASLQALLIFMAIDYITGIIVAGVFNRSKKSETGALNSNSGFKGIVKKGVQLFIVLIGYQLDNVLGTNFIRNCVIFAIIANELVSIMENVGLMGIQLPPVLTKAFDIFTEKGDDKK